MISRSIACAVEDGDGQHLAVPNVRYIVRRGRSQVNASWPADLLARVADGAREHPVLVGAFLLVILVSTALHVVIFATHLLLGVSRYFRRQASELNDLRLLIGVELSYWRRDIDFKRARTASMEEINSELRQQEVDPRPTTALVTSIVTQVLRELNDTPQRDASPHSEASAGSRTEP